MPAIDIDHRPRLVLPLAVAIFAFLLLPEIHHAQTSSSVVPAKLAAPLADLAQSLPQERGAVSKLRAAQPVAVESMPKTARDSVQTGMMRLNQQGEVQVYILLTEFSPAHVQALEAAGAIIEMQEASQRIVQAEVPAARLAQISELPFVNFVRLPTYSRRSIGAVTSEGDAIHRADLVRQQLHVDGKDVFIGVLSDGIKGVFDKLCTTCFGAPGGPISSFDLPSATGTRDASGILTSSTGGIKGTSFDARKHDLEGIPRDNQGNPRPCGFPGAGAEGTALLEIIHDIAPGASLSFANFTTHLEFNQAVNSLAANNDVVVDDIGFFGFPFDGTSIVSANTTNALNSNTNTIRAYVTSVGNGADHHYLETYKDSATDGFSITSNHGNLHLFQTTADTTDTLALGQTTFNTIKLSANGEVVVFLSWDDTFGSSTNRYDLYLVSESTGKVVTSSINRGCPVTTPQDPVECFAYVNSGAEGLFDILIQNVGNAAPKNLNLYAFTPECAQAGLLLLYPPNRARINFNTIKSSIIAQGDAGGGVISVGAICSGSNAAFISHPTSCNDLPLHDQIEYFSSRGPTLDGRVKPDISGIDGVSITGAGSFVNPFFGTSASAPHVAGIAALVLQSAPCLLTNVPGSLANTTARNNLRSLLLNNAVPLGSPIPNNTFGYGRADALNSANATLPVFQGPASITVSGNTPTGASVKPDQLGFSDPNTCPLISVQWTGGCGSGGPAGTMPCKFGTNSVSVAASNNGLSFPAAKSLQLVVTNFSLSAAPTSATVKTGQAATYTVTASGVGGAFVNPITLGCSNLPPGASCTFNPPIISPQSVNTVARALPALGISSLPRYLLSLVRTRPDTRPGRGFHSAPVWLLVWALAGIGFISLLNFIGIKLAGAQLLAALGAAFMTLVFITIQMACGGGSGPPPPSPPSVNLAPTSLVFAAQRTGTTSTPQSVVLTNTGSSAVSITSVSTTAEFAATHNCGASLSAGANCTINVIFAPAAGGTRTGTLSVGDNAAGAPHTVTLSGTGIPATSTLTITAPQLGTYNIGITGTSGTLVNSAAVTLVVQ